VKLASATDKGLFPLESELAWQREAACRGLGIKESQAIFFPSRGDSIDEARAICGRCPVTEECLDFALANNCIGVWAGTSDRQRRRLKRGNRSAAGQMLGSARR
jgi:WhiB family transcriptional regulator, redox-sensing transcriptional regulator